MKAWLIIPDSESIEAVDVSSLNDIKALIGFDTLEVDAIGTDGDKLYFDEECFLRGSTGRFQIDTLVPVSGKGVILAGEGAELHDAVVTLAALQARIKFL